MQLKRLCSDNGKRHVHRSSYVHRSRVRRSSQTPAGARYALVERRTGCDDTPRTTRCARELRECLGLLLIVAERIVRETGNRPMVALEDNQDGTGRATSTVRLNRDDPLPEN